MKKIELIIGVFYTIITIIIYTCYKLNKIDYFYLFIPDILFIIIMMFFPLYKGITLPLISNTVIMILYSIRICLFI